MSLPIRNDQLACILRRVAHGVRGVRPEHIADLVCYLHLAVAAEQPTILFRFAVQHDRVVRISLVQGHRHSCAILLQILGDFHRFVMRVDRRTGAPGSPMRSAAPGPAAGYVFGAFALNENPRLVLSRCKNGTPDKKNCPDSESVHALEFAC